MAVIKYQDWTIDSDDVYEKTIRIDGGKKSDWTSPEGVKYDHVNVTVSEPYHKDGSFGRGTSNYRYGEAKDIAKEVLDKGIVITLSEDIALDPAKIKDLA